jgi:activating signal cointegrator complex subunit 3
MGLIKECLEKLEKAKCIEYNKDDGSIVSTVYGYYCSFYYIFHETINRLNTEIKPGMNHQSLFIPLLTNCKEFDGLPVRHNEDQMNEGLATMCPIKVPKSDLDSPHVKANLLIQAHLSRAPLPITDYITDTKSVLDQAARVIQCMIDVSSQKGYLDTTLNLLSFQQMIIQGRWQNDSIFINIPHFNERIIRKLAKMGIYHLCQLQTKLHDLTNFFRKELKEKDISTEELKMIYSALSRVPIVKMKYYLQATNSMGDATTGPINEGEEAILTFSLERMQHKNSRSVLIKSFPKPKDAGWFVVVGNPTENKLLSLKRVPLKRFTKREVQLLLPDNFKSQKLKLYLISDSYMGIDQVITIDCNKVRAVLEKSQEQDSKANLENQMELVENMIDDSDEDYEERPEDFDHNELSDSDYSYDSVEDNASDISDDLIEKNVD